MSLKAGLDQESKRVSCLRLPQRQADLLLPSVAVAEVDAVPFFEPTIGNAPWLYGTYNWHDVEIPLIDFDVIAHDAPPLKEVRYIAILHSQNAETKVPFFCIAMQGIPLQYMIEYGDLQLEAVGGTRLAIADLELEKSSVIIPELVELEKKLIAVL